VEPPPHLSSPLLITTLSRDQYILTPHLQSSPSSSTRPSLKRNLSSISINTPSSSVSLVLLAGGISQPPSLETSLPGYKPKPISILKRKASGYFRTLLPTLSTNFGSRSSPTITSPLTSAQIELLDFPSPQTTRRLLHLWCPAISKQAFNPDTSSVVVIHVPPIKSKWGLFEDVGTISVGVGPRIPKSKLRVDDYSKLRLLTHLSKGGQGGMDALTLAMPCL